MHIDTLRQQARSSAWYQKPDGRPNFNPFSKVKDPTRWRERRASVAAEEALSNTVPEHLIAAVEKNLPTTVQETQPTLGALPYVDTDPGLPSPHAPDLNDAITRTPIASVSSYGAEDSI